MNNEKEESMTDCFDPQQYKVALLAGGKSGEREISLSSGAGARAALEEAGFVVTTIDPAEKSELKKLLEEPFDVAFLCLHGKYGEDGTIQGMLEILGIPYIGSGVWSSALAINKVKSKVFYEKAGIPTPPSVSVRRGEVPNVQEIVAKLGDHCVIKPATEGSSLGMSIVEGAEAVATAIQEACKYDSQVIVERYVKGMEFTVAVVGNEEPEALPIIKIVPASEFYDFDSKYAPGGSQHLCPAPLPEDKTAEIQGYAVRAHQALECRGVSRSDFIIDEEGNSWILETNTIPGMTATSLLPDAAKAAGIAFPDLCTKLIQLALEK